MREDVTIESAAALDTDDCRRLVLASEPWITLGYDDTDVQGIVRSAATDHLLLARVDGRPRVRERALPGTRPAPQQNQR